MRVVKAIFPRNFQEIYNAIVKTINKDFFKEICSKKILTIFEMLFLYFIILYSGLQTHRLRNASYLEVNGHMFALKLFTYQIEVYSKN